MQIHFAGRRFYITTFVQCGLKVFQLENFTFLIKHRRILVKQTYNLISVKYNDGLDY